MACDYFNSEKNEEMAQLLRHATRKPIYLRTQLIKNPHDADLSVAPCWIWI